MENKIKLIKKKGANPQTQASIYYAQVKQVKTVDYSNTDYDGKGISEATMDHALDELVKQITKTLKEGNSYKIDGLGTFKLKVKSESSDTEKGLTANSVKYNGVQFLVNKKLKETLEKIKFEFDGVSVSTEDEDEEQNSTPDSGREEVE